MKDRRASPFHQHVLDVHPDLAPGEMKKLKNQYWNAFKHATGRNDVVQQDTDLLERFDDEKNDHVFIGWYDYVARVGTLPIEAQVFQAWHFVNFPDKLAEEADLQKFIDLFSGVRDVPRNKSKQMLRQKIRWARGQREVMADPRTDRRQLFLDGGYFLPLR